MTAAAPSGVVTFLFTDIEGSTRRWEADAQAMRAAPRHPHVCPVHLCHAGPTYRSTFDDQKRGSALLTVVAAVYATIEQ